VTGVLYAEPGPAGLERALERLRTLRLNPADALANAARFSRARFRAHLLEELSAILRTAGKAHLADELPSFADARMEPA
jgi:hypothetical protein